VAVWDAEQEWIEMRLRARWATALTLAALPLQVSLAPGEEIRSEISAKFRWERLATELTEAGFSPAGWWTDRQDWFSLSLWRVG
jgi:L-histidine Nalpha-methyltransferase